MLKQIIIFLITYGFFTLTAYFISILPNKQLTITDFLFLILPNFSVAWALLFYKIKNEGTSPVDITVKYGLGLNSPDDSVNDIVEVSHKGN